MVDEPLFGITLTIGAYVLMSTSARRWDWVNPALFASLLIMGLLWLLQIDYSAYARGGDYVTFFLGPATVALAVPLVKQIRTVKQQLPAILGGVLSGAGVSIVTAGGVAWLMGASPDVVATLIPKSATTAISVELANGLGGVAGLTAVFTTLTGLLGNLFGYWLFARCGIVEPVARGVAMGTAAHGIGTARALQHSELEGGLSSLAMALTGIATAILLVPLYP
ncbi:MAG: LrgB family protein [Gammaproteobacteria bacterium]|nr:LrgB family protein [Gammaproteobacteria bacterium]